MRRSVSRLLFSRRSPRSGARPAGADVGAGADGEERPRGARPRAGGDLHERHRKQTGEDLPGYLAKLKVMEVKKGDVKPGEEVLVTWRAVPKDVAGPGPSTTTPAKRWSRISPSGAAA